jgi:hypothetical protein
MLGRFAKRFFFGAKVLPRSRLPPVNTDALGGLGMQKDIFRLKADNPAIMIGAGT